MNLYASACALILLYCLVLITASFRKKSRIVTGVSIQCSSGDSEVMSLNYNFVEGESEDSKNSKIAEAFARIQERRDENHAKYLEIKAKAIKENEERFAEQLKMDELAQVGGQEKARLVQ